MSSAISQIVSHRQVTLKPAAKGLKKDVTRSAVRRAVGSKNLKVECKASTRSSKQSWAEDDNNTKFNAGKSAVTLATAASLLMSQLAPAALAGDNYMVGEFNASGLVFKDSVEVIAFDDPKVDGVKMYVSEFKRSIAAKLQKDFFSEPSQASLTCTTFGPVILKVDLATLSKDGEEVYKERKNLSLSNKTLRVRRMYDSKANVLVYVAYSTRLSGTPDDDVSPGRYKTSLCAVPVTIPEPESEVVVDPGNV